MDKKDIQLYILENRFKKINIFDHYNTSIKLALFLSKNGIRSHITGIDFLELNNNNSIKTEIIKIALNKDIKYLRNFFFINNFKIIKSSRNSITIFYENKIFTINGKLHFNGLIKISEKRIIVFYFLNLQLNNLNEKIKKLSNFRLVNKKIKYFIKFLIWLTLEKLNFKVQARNFRYSKISREEFLNLKFKDDNILNNIVRKEHFNLITNNNKLKTNKQIIKYFFKNKNLQKTKNLAKQPTKLKLRNIPRHLDRHFWENGNSYFFNNMITGFRKGVIDYSSLKDQQSDEDDIIFSNKYYQRKQYMSDLDIKKLLYDNPIEINFGSISSGRHRVSAMLGRLIEGKKYLPFYKDKL